LTLRLQLADTIGTRTPLLIDPESLWQTLRRSGWIARINAQDDPELLINQAAAVIAALPDGEKHIDRRRLADTVTRFPHALDTGSLPGLVLAILTAAGRIPPGSPPRAAWTAVGVDCDDLTGGLLALGIAPSGWHLPAEAVVTLPPRELSRGAWPVPPHPGTPIFVTENPSVVTAAADRVLATPPARQVRLLCTVGTPSRSEIDAIRRLADTGWQILVRADFDQAGLQHVNALLNGVPTALPWRMNTEDYLASLADTPADDRIHLRADALPPTPWCPTLQQVMGANGVAAYEESLIESLLADLIQPPSP
jgi:uncharacterized protein (TIGR02679 family)